ncbi:MAG: hypothetical protein HY330_00930 [Chloroflexi bacterium]|nr:hypothetical protein [Chloroflexota bacterium]
MRGRSRIWWWAFDATVPRLFSLDSLSRSVSAGLPAVRWHHPTHPNARPTSNCFDPTLTSTFARHTGGPCPYPHARICTFVHGYGDDPSAADACPAALFTDGGTHAHPHTLGNAGAHTHADGHACSHTDAQPDARASANAHTHT